MIVVRIKCDRNSVKCLAQPLACRRHLINAMIQRLSVQSLDGCCVPCSVAHLELLFLKVLISCLENMVDDRFFLVGSCEEEFR